MDIMSSECHYVKACGKHTIVCDVILPVGELSTKRIPKMLKREAHPKFLRHVRDDSISEENTHFRLGAVADGDDL